MLKSIWQIQWWSEYWPKNIWVSNFLKFFFQMVWYSNGQSIYYVWCTRPTIWITKKHKKTRWHPFVWYSNGWSSTSNIVNRLTIWIPNHLKKELQKVGYSNVFGSVFRSPLNLPNWFQHHKVYRTKVSRISSSEILRNVIISKSFILIKILDTAL